MQHVADELTEQYGGFGTANYCYSRYLLTHRELPNIREVPRKYPHLSSVTYWVFTNLPDIREVLWNGPTSVFGHSFRIGRLTERPGSFSKVPTSEFWHLSRIFKLPNIRQVLPLIILSQVLLGVFTHTIILLKFMDRHTTMSNNRNICVH